MPLKHDWLLRRLLSSSSRSEAHSRLQDREHCRRLLDCWLAKVRDELSLDGLRALDTSGPSIGSPAELKDIADFLKFYR